jgi:molybdenum cofactor biosynthesis enzyme MoaA
MHHRRVYVFDTAEVEVVDPVFNPEFCYHCHRIRVTHKGELKGCLNRSDDLVPTRGLDDDGVRIAYRQVITQRVPFYGVYRTEFPRRVPEEAPMVSLPVLPNSVQPTGAHVRSSGPSAETGESV